jgi:hypothetical protein
MNHLIIFTLLLIGSCGYALARGGAPERIVAVALLGATVATNVALSGLSTRFFDVEAGVLIVDMLLFVLLTEVAMRADRGWPILLGGRQLATVATHLIKLLHPDLIRVIYAFAIAMWSYPMVLVLALGTWRHQRRLRRQGYDLDWMLPREVEEG